MTDLEVVTFHWSTEHGRCYDCGLPAAFYRVIGDSGAFPRKLCAICAANSAADGEEIHRIEATVGGRLLGEWETILRPYLRDEALFYAHALFDAQRGRGAPSGAQTRTRTGRRAASSPTPEDRPRAAEIDPGGA